MEFHLPNLEDLSLDELAHLSVKLASARTDLHRVICSHAQREYGLVAGVTRVQQDGKSGTFLEILNYIDRGPPWIRVRLDTPDPATRWRIQHFFGDWKRLDPTDP